MPEIMLAFVPHGLWAGALLRLTALLLLLTAGATLVPSNALAVGNKDTGSTYFSAQSCTSCHTVGVTGFYYNGNKKSELAPIASRDALITLLRRYEINSSKMQTLADNQTDVDDVAAYFRSFMPNATVSITKSFSDNADRITSPPTIGAKAECRLNGELVDERAGTFLANTTLILGNEKDLNQFKSGESCMITEDSITGGSLSGGYTFDPPSAAVVSPSGALRLVTGNNAVTLTNSLTAPAALSILPATTLDTPFGFTARLGVAPSPAVTFQVTNSGGAGTTLSLGTLTPPGNYSNTGTCANGTTLHGATSESCTVVLAFMPVVVGAADAQFLIPSTAGNRTIFLRGTGTQSQISPTAETTLDFPDTEQGVLQSVTRFVSVSNTGTASLNFNFNVTDALLGGAQPGDFHVTSDCRQSAPLMPPPLGGNSCTITVSFTPRGVGDRHASLTVLSDATNLPSSALVVNLHGKGTSLPPPTVEYPSQPFAAAVIGDPPAQTQIVTIKNPRARDVVYSLPDATDFKVVGDNCTGRVVPGKGGSCIVKLQFRPVAAGGEGVRTATVQVSLTPAPGDPLPTVLPGQVSGTALWPLARSTDKLAPKAVLNTSVATTVLLTNRSVSGLTLASFVMGGAVPGDYAVDPSSQCVPNLVLATGQSCTLTLRLTPHALGELKASLAINHSAAGSPQSIALNGTGLPVPKGLIQLSMQSSTISFPDTQVGSRSSLSIVVHNGGDAIMQLGTFVTAGGQAADFSTNGCDPGTSLAFTPPNDPTTSCTLRVTFAPTGLDDRTTMLTIRSDASNDPYPIVLTGNGVPVPAPLVTLMPSPLTFGSQTVGGLYAPRAITLTNSGTANLVTSHISVTGSAFGIVNSAACGASLAPGVSCDIMVSFTPTGVDTEYAGILTVASNATGSPQNVALSGRGTSTVVPSLVLSPAVTRIEFGAISAGSVSPVQIVTLVNNGPGGVLLSVLNAVGPDGASFSVASDDCPIGTPLFPATPCHLALTFVPGSAGAKTALLQIASTGSAPPALMLSGTGLGGVAPGLNTSASAMAFGVTRVDAQSLPLELVLSGTGAGVVTVTGIGVAGSFKLQNKTCPAVPFTLLAGSLCTVTVTFVPGAEGAATGKLSITSDAAPAEREVSLSGQGEKPADFSSGGCSISGGAGSDPTLWALVLLAVAALCYRARVRRAAARRQL